MTANERRLAIIELLCVRKFETRANLAFEFGVSKRTIEYDIECLSVDYPIYTVPGKGGGIRIMDGYRNGKKYLSEEQAQFLSGLMSTLSGDKRTIAESILKDFGMPAKNGRDKH
ncbi:MAG: HTH domain-containing protein [Clostridia bacterium]|nr:HTH domain-containing protein [Clostridia bacterium]